MKNACPDYNYYNMKFYSFNFQGFLIRSSFILQSVVQSDKCVSGKMLVL